MTSAEQIARLDVALRPFPVDYAFIGGGVLSLLVTDPSASAVRVTMDVDVLTDTHTRRDYQRLERPLSERGFHHDMIAGAPICLFDGRPELVGEIRAAPEVLRQYLAERFARYIAAPDLEAAVEGFVQTEPSPEFRMAAILARFREVASLAISRVNVPTS